MTENDLFPKPKRLETTIDPTTGKQAVRVAESISPEELLALEREAQKSSPLEPSEPVSPLQRVSSWLLSLSFHVLLMILLALILLPGKKSDMIRAIFSEEIGDQLDIQTLDEGNLNPTLAENYSVDIPLDVKIDDLFIYEQDKKPYLEDANAPIFDQTRINVEEMLSGRTDPGTKNDLLAKYGGNETTQEAVRRGLLWLKRNQFSDGHWSLLAPYSDGRSSSDNPVAATGLALLAFQGDGNATSFGEHSRVVKKAWKWLLDRQSSNGCFCDEGTPGNDYYYTHSIATIALCELLSMEEQRGRSVPKLRKAAQAAVDYLLQKQNKSLGGWRYKMDTHIDSDLSVTTWALIALQTAKMAKLDVPESAFYLVEQFVDSVASEDGSRYAYRTYNNPSVSMTASGLMSRMFLGWNRDHPGVLQGAEYLTLPENLIKYPTEENSISYNTYAWYMTSMFLKQLGPTNKYWRRWNKSLCQEIPNRQEPQKSPEAGSWSPSGDTYGYSGGRLYTTVLSILCLEVYYRHLAIFQ